MLKEKRPGPVRDGEPGIGTSSLSDPSIARPEAKWRRTLREITWLHRFIAERVCGDHTLPSTVSELEKAKGLTFERREIAIAGYAGAPARVMAYRVAPGSLARARELLGLPRSAP